MLLNAAESVHVGAAAADAVYLGDTKVWPSHPTPTITYEAAVRAYNPLRLITTQMPERDTVGVDFTDAVGATWRGVYSAANYSWAPGPRSGLRAATMLADSYAELFTSLAPPSPWTAVALARFPSGGVQRGMFGGKNMEQALDQYHGPTTLTHVWFRDLEVSPVPLPPDWCLVALTDTGTQTTLTVASDARTVTATSPSHGKWAQQYDWYPFCRGDAPTPNLTLAGIAVLPVALTAPQVTDLYWTL